MKEVFLQRMQQYLGNEYEAYVESLSKPLYRGLRLNTTKTTIQEIMEEKLCTLKPSAICNKAYYIQDEESSLGNHAAHAAGLFYMQDVYKRQVLECSGFLMSRYCAHIVFLLNMLLFLLVLYFLFLMQ